MTMALSGVNAMRVISQDGSMDYPYDNIILTIFCGDIYVCPFGEARPTMVAHYNSLEDAQDEMNRLHHAYTLMNCSVFQFCKQSELRK